MADALFGAPGILNSDALEVGCRGAGFLVRLSVAEIEDLWEVFYFATCRDLCEMRGIV